MTVNQVKFLLLATIISLAIGCGKKPDDETKSDPPKDNPPPLQKGDPVPAPKSTPEIKSATEELLATKPDVVLKDQELMAEWQKDKALTKYNGKVVDVTGVVKRYTTAGYTRPALGCSELLFVYVCGEADALSRVAPGQTVTLRAKPNPQTGWSNCVIVKIEGPPPSELTADELAKAFSDGAEGAKKYSGKYVRLNGKMGAIRDNGPLVNVVLSSPGVKPEIICEFEDRVLEQAKKQWGLKEGDAVRILAECSSIGQPKLYYPAVLPPLK